MTPHTFNVAAVQMVFKPTIEGNVLTDTARINEICRRRRGISARMALMLGQAFSTSAALWMNLQKNWELSQVDPRAVGRIKPLRISA